MEQVVLRKATLQDIPAVVELWKEMIDFHMKRDLFFTRADNSEEVFARFVEKNISSETACVYVATVGGTIVGYCQGTLEKHPPVLTEIDYGQILDFAVAADYRRAGVGEKLCRALQGWFVLKGMHRLEVRHSEFNEIASRFWQKMGFKPYMKSLFKVCLTGRSEKKFEFDGEKYKLSSSQQKAWGRKLITEFQFKGDEKILDLGCGDGVLTAELAKLVPDGFVLGIDASESMIETAQKDHAGANMRFELLDINAIDFESEFDLVFSNATLHWVKDHGKLLRSVFKSLKDGGTARFQFAGDGNCSNLIRILRRVMLARDYASYFSEFDWPWYMPAVDEYQVFLDEVAFAEKKVWSENGDKHFESAEAMTKWIDQPSLVPFLCCVAKKDRQRFRDVVVERMIKETLQDDGTFFETFRRINVLVRK
jgi:trans-aconitate methyltransferase/ribosomal protein S18 acetylase RimI-like enzyme